MIVLDIDGVICDFYHGFYEFIGEEPTYHPGYNDPKIDGNFWRVVHNKEFWLGLSVMDRPKFDVDYYLTSRPVDSLVTYKWLLKHDFPKAHVITVKHASEKLPILREIGATLVIEDHPTTYQQIEQAGIKVLLIDAWYNRNIDANRIKNLDDVNIHLFKKI